MSYDFFFSYEHNDLPLVEKLVETIESYGYVCWYAPRNVSGRYAQAISEGIRYSKYFLLLVNSKSAVSEEVLNEVEMAHNVAKKSPYGKLIPIYTECIDIDDPTYGELMYFIHRIQFVSLNKTMTYIEMLGQIQAVYPELFKKEKQRFSSNYVVWNIEDLRIQQQNLLMNSFDMDVYMSVFQKYSSPRILDVGCGTGDMLLDRLVNVKDLTYIGLDKSMRQIETAINKHTSSNVHFFNVNIESNEFLNTLKEFAKQIKVEEFDVIHISMVLLHLKNPYALLTTLREFLSTKGTLLIRDIDDGINFAYPDPNNDFERIYRMCNRDEQSGYRKTGRQIYTHLVRAGYKNITLQKSGLTSIGMNTQAKDTFFQIYFPFTLQNAKVMHEKYPWNFEIKNDYEWYQKHYDEIYQRFMKEEFIFSLGFQTYTATRER